MSRATQDRIKRLNIINETVDGANGAAFAEISGRRYVLANVTKMKFKYKVNTSKHGVLGLTGKQVKPAGWEGTWEASLYYNQSTLRELARVYNEEGVLPVINIQVVNEDPASIKKIGRQSVTFIDCITEEILLAALDVDTDALEEDVSGTFNDFRFNEKFNELPTA